MRITITSQPMHNEELIATMKYSTALLDIIDHRDDYDRGDLQGAVDAQVLQAYRQGRLDERDRLEKKAGELVDDYIIQRIF